MAVEARLTALERRNPPVEAMVCYVPSDAVARQITDAATAAGTPEPLCIVSGGAHGPQPVIIGSIRELMADIAKNGRSIVEHAPASIGREWPLWRKPVPSASRRAVT